jgi:hypothetical protein
MADFALWAAACESALWPSGTFSRVYAGNRRAAIESMVDADPVAACVREIMAERSAWTGSAAGLLRAQADVAGDGVSRSSPGWPKNPRALAGRLRRAQAALRTLGINMTFGREGRAGTRIIRMSKALECTASTDSSVHNNGSRSGQRHPTTGLETGRQSADDADAADAKLGSYHPNYSNYAFIRLTHFRIAANNRGRSDANLELRLEPILRQPRRWRSIRLWMWMLN